MLFQSGTLVSSTQNSENLFFSRVAMYSSSLCFSAGVNSILLKYLGTANTNCAISSLWSLSIWQNNIQYRKVSLHSFSAFAAFPFSIRVDASRALEPITAIVPSKRFEKAISLSSAMLKYTNKQRNKETAALCAIIPDILSLNLLSFLASDRTARQQP